jgi:hypothetical protein
VLGASVTAGASVAPGAAVAGASVASGAGLQARTVRNLARLEGVRELVAQVEVWREKAEKVKK